MYCNDGLSECVFGVGISTASYTEIDCISNSGDRIVADSGDEVVCPLVEVIGPSEEEMEAMESNTAESAKLDTLSCDDVVRNEAQKLQADSGGVLLHDCDQESECAAGTFDGGDWYECTGYTSCDTVDFDNVGGAYCRGSLSCQHSNVVHGDLECSGFNSCYYMFYGDSGDVSVECNGNVC